MFTNIITKFFTNTTAANLANLTAQVRELEEDVRMMKAATCAQDAALHQLHSRIDQHSLRTSHIEHYLGLRSHSFEKGERMWDFNQIATHVAKGTKPERPTSLFRMGNNKRRTPNEERISKSRLDKPKREIQRQRDCLARAAEVLRLEKLEKKKARLCEKHNFVETIISGEKHYG